MKKALKIFGITLGSIVILLTLLIGSALWVVFTPERLTPIVRNVAKGYVKCEHHIGKVELTFFSTFPHFGLAIDSLTVVNPVEGAPSDTVAHIPHAVVSVDMLAFLNEKTLSIPTLRVPDMQANIYVAADGTANYDVLALPTDTTAEDTTTMALPFEQIKVGELAISAKSLGYESLPDSISATLGHTSITANIANWDDIQATLRAEDIVATIGNTTYAQGLSFEAHIPAAVDLARMRVDLLNAQLSVNTLGLSLNGWAEAGDTLQTNMHLTLNDWQVDSVMPLLPFTLPKDIAQLIQGGSASLDATAAINMANGKASSVTIHNLAAHTKQTSLQAQGEVKDPLGNLWANLSADMDVRVADVRQFLPKDMQVAGRVKGTASVQMYLDDLMEMNLHKGKVAGNLQLMGIAYNANGIAAKLPNNRLTFQIPNSQPSRPEVDWLQATLHTDGADIRMAQPLQADLGNTHIAIEANNILGDNPLWHAILSLQSTEPLHAAMDSMEVVIDQPDIQAYVAYHTTDTTVMPVVDARIAFNRLSGHYTDMQADIQASTLTAQLQAPRLKATLQSNQVAAQMPNVANISTQHISIEAAARYNARGGNNLLLKWNPRLSVSMQQAIADLADWEQNIVIPEIDFAYTNRECKIEQSKLIIGNSDFALTGELRNIGRWLREKGTLEGEMTFISEQTDANELLALLSADQGSEEEAPAAEATRQEGDEAIEEATEPFLVPTNVNLTLNTQIKKAHLFNQTATNLGGRIYVKDGTLVLEEMGFICNAAKLQLTAMYRTPRRNHIYVGFDYHMLDVNIQELVNMIPQIDSMMPMLRSFKGEAEFHLAAETYTNAQYQIKPSTIRGAASIFGKDLVVLDNETFSTISKLLMFSKKTENRVDSISAEMTIYKKEIDVYPFCVSIDNYMVALGGRHNLDMTFNYDVNVLSPIYLGVNVSGNLDDLDIKLAPCKFAKDFKPLFHRKVDTQSAEIRSMIRESMRKNVKIQ
ncbi:MAG: hypothetical protein IJX60_04270 [Paludibacteraceae bacterium]|nr:hypothetical protein [Paludibacteraceae bacterium]